MLRNRFNRSVQGDPVAWPSPSIIVINIKLINYNILANKLITKLSRFFVTGSWHPCLFNLANLATAGKIAKLS